MIGLKHYQVHLKQAGSVGRADRSRLCAPGLMVGLSSHNVSHTHHYEQMEHCEYVHVRCFFYVALSSEEIAINTKSTCTFSQNTVICSEIKRKIQRGALVTLNEWYGLAIGTAAQYYF